MIWDVKSRCQHWFCHASNWPIPECRVAVWTCARSRTTVLSSVEFSRHKHFQSAQTTASLRMQWSICEQLTCSWKMATRRLVPLWFCGGGLFLWWQINNQEESALSRLTPPQGVVQELPSPPPHTHTDYLTLINTLSNMWKCYLYNLFYITYFKLCPAVSERFHDELCNPCFQIKAILNFYLFFKFNHNKAGLLIPQTNKWHSRVKNDRQGLNKPVWQRWAWLDGMSKHFCKFDNLSVYIRRSNKRAQQAHAHGVTW